MEQVRNVVKSAGRRLFINDLFQALAITLSLGIGALILARLVERVLGLTSVLGPHWQTILLSAAVVSVLAAFLWTLVIRRKAMQVATEVDARADLRESLSTALAIEPDIKARAPWAVAVEETATSAASKVRVAQVIPYEAPPAWPAPVLSGLAMAVIWYAVPNLDLLRKDGPKIAQKQREKEVLQVKTDVARDKEKLQELLSKANVDLREGKADELVPEQAQLENDPEAIKRAALKDLTDLSSKLEDKLASEKAMQTEALQEAMEQLKQPGPGPLNDLAKAMQKGDFAAAKQSLEQLARKLESNELSQEQKDELKKQLGNMGQQLKDLAKDQKALERSLQDAGLDKKTAEEMAKAASDPAKLQEALSKMPGLNDQMKNELMKMAQAQQQAQQQCSNMGQSMSQMSAGINQQGMSQQGSQAMDQLNQALSDSEMMQSDMENLNAALDEAKDQMAKLGQSMKQGKKGKGQGDGEGDDEGEGEGEGSGKLGEWRAGNSTKSGKGSGGPGQGDGKSPDAEPADYALEKKKADVQTRKGAIIGSRLVYGEQVKGEAIAEFADAVAAGQQTVSEGIEGMRVPKELEGAVKQYFGRLKDKAEKKPAPDKAGNK